MSFTIVIQLPVVSQPHSPSGSTFATERRGATSLTVEETAFRNFVVKVKSLWVEFPRKGLDLRFVN